MLSKRRSILIPICRSESKNIYTEFKTVNKSVVICNEKCLPWSHLLTTLQTLVPSIEQDLKSAYLMFLDCCYLEHAGTTLYSERQIADACAELRENMYANPHALNTFSKTTDDAVDQIRYQ